ncbi:MULTISPECIES: DUF1120 domain-containing protein [unclassified Burkholderia]|uniref:DUF1120 domain-containing protein n=1 Tax=unclassified Burkholderia TaxID=2613784 RepID=UPI000B7A3CDE|nr:MULTISPECIES: DUF1120 domain-containing protein [unclassified Burkholderia]MCA8064030.1 DUF1120 domain-containing protein [Burkholderia sp. AU38729]OXI15245.1 hypothetical protein CFB43_32430 [Burkholderia sp. AU15512]
MKKKLAGLGLVAGVLAVAGHAQAETSAEIKITGKILPDACNLTIGNGGVYDFGSIASANLYQDKTTQLPGKLQTVSISCNAAAKVALNVRDNRSGTAAGGAGDDTEFGLGNGKVGYYKLSLGGATGDNSGVDIVAAPAGSDAWASDAAGLMTKGSARKSFAKPGDVTPGAYKTVTANLTVIPTINKLSELDLSGGSVDLDGSATIEMAYL